MVRLNQAVANKLISSVDYLRESFVGTLERCLNSLEKSHIDSSVHNVTSNHLKQVGSKQELFFSLFLLFQMLVSETRRRLNRSKMVVFISVTGFIIMFLDSCCLSAVPLNRVNTNLQ